MGDDDQPPQEPEAVAGGDAPQDPADDPWIGQSLAGYTILKRIGEGGMGIVYLARHESLGRNAAVKFLGAHMTSDAAYVERFLQEARGAAKLNHPNIVQVYDAGRMEGDVYYFIMEFIEGRDLGSLLREVKIFSVADALGYCRQGCAALGYAHQKGIIHRDVKPDNFMLTRDGAIKIGDLGLAKWTGDDASGGMTQTGIVMGTPFYIAPEQVRGARDVDARADVYSLGATLFHMVTSRIPFEGPSPAVIMAMHLNNPVPEPSRINPALDRDLCAIIKKMMSKKPQDRYQDMQEVDAIFQEYESRSHQPSRILKSPAPEPPDASAPAAPAPLGAEPFIFQSEPGHPVRTGVLTAVSTLLAGVLIGATLPAILRSAAKPAEPAPAVTAPVELPAPDTAPEPAADLPPSALPPADAEPAPEKAPEPAEPVEPPPVPEAPAPPVS